VRVYILDSSAIFLRKGIYPSMLTVSKVLGEIRDVESKDYLSFLDIKVRDPKVESVEEVREVSRKTGDLYKLSETDLCLLALALELKKEGRDPVVVTDDYSIQNVARVFGIKIDSIFQKGIREKLRWVRICKGCGRRVEEGEFCPVCGSEVHIVRVREG
jgi:UPF0271 protein